MSHATRQHVASTHQLGRAGNAKHAIFYNEAEGELGLGYHFMGNTSVQVKQMYKAALGDTAEERKQICADYSKPVTVRLSDNTLC